MSGGVIKTFKIPETPHWGIQSNYYSPALVEACKAVPGMQLDYPRRTWWGYVDAVIATCARLREKGITVLGTDEFPEPDAWRQVRTPYLFAAKHLRPYQVEGVQFILTKAHEGALLADGMRLGKSCQATTAARAFKCKTVVVCPSHLTGVWGRSPDDIIGGPGEIAKWWPDAWRAHPESGARGVVRLEGIKPAAASNLIAKYKDKKQLSSSEQTTYDAARAEIISRAVVLQDAQVIICHADIVYAWVDVLIEWDFSFLIVDEIHMYAGYQSRRSDSMKRLRAHARRALGLTGTPITNMPQNAHNVLDLMCPGRFGYFFSQKNPNGGHFSRLYCDFKYDTVGTGAEQKVVPNFKGASNLDAPDGRWALTQEETLKARMAHMTLRRLKKDVDSSLPSKTRDIIDVNIPAKHVIAVGMSTLDKGGKELRRILNLAADGKLPHVVRRILDHLNEGEKVIAFGYRKAFVEEVAEQVVRKHPTAAVDFIHGDVTSLKEREKRMQRIRTADGPGVLVGSIDTISTGIDLSFAQVGVVGELSWEYHEIEQLEERMYAFGAESKVLLEYIIARGTGDELILKGVIEKIDVADRIVGSAKDGMKEDFSKKRDDGLKRLAQALIEMNRAKEEPKTGRRAKRKGV